MKRVLSLLLPLCLLLCGCARRNDAFVPAYQEPAKEMSDNPGTGKTEEPDVNDGQDLPSGNLPSAAESAVYYLPGGEVCHLFADCSYLRGKENVQKGTREEATAAGIGRICSRCQKRLERGDENDESNG